MTLKLETKDLKDFIEWVEKCPFGYRITSMNGEAIHVKFFLKESEDV
ncbi:hypothetical protein [Limnobacter sp.]|nr:hypothetical protein [Limnobacter sp.]